MSGNLGGAEQHAVKLFRCKIIAVLVLLVPHGNGEGQHLNIQFLPQGAGDIGGRIGNHFYVSHSGLLKSKSYVSRPLHIGPYGAIIAERAGLVKKRPSIFALF